MQIKNRIVGLSAVLSLMISTQVFGVEYEGVTYPDDNTIEGKYYLIVDPPAELENSKSDDLLETWQREVAFAVQNSSRDKSDSSPQILTNSEGDVQYGWKNSIKFELDASQTQAFSIANELQTQFRQQKSDSLSPGSRVRIDQVMYPMQSGDLVRQWMYDAPAVDPGAANIRDVWKDEESYGDNIVVAVIDTGTIQHTELENLRGYDFITSTNYSGDGDGRDDNPIDEGDFWTDKKGRFIPSSWHGAHVQGTIAGQVNRARKYTGVAPGVKILPLRVLGTGGGISSDIQDAIAYAAGRHIKGLPFNQHKADIINLSLGGRTPSVCSPDYQEVFDYARSQGVVVVVAAGNSNNNSEYFSPGNCKGIITVAANTREGRRAKYSNYGKNITIAAPGGETNPRGNGVMSTVSPDRSRLTKVPHTAYAEYQGTSMATPVVSGIVALMQSHSLKTNGRKLSPDRIEAIISQTARDFPVSNQPAFQCAEDTCGSGVIDALAAVRAVSGSPNPINGKYPKLTVEECFSAYEIAKRLYGEDKAAQIYPDKISYSGPCPGNGSSQSITIGGSTWSGK